MIAICNPNLEAAFSRFGLVMNVLVFGSWHHQSFWHITSINRGDDQDGCEIADCWVSLKIGSPKKSIVHHHFPQQQLGYTVPNFQLHPYVFLMVLHGLLIPIISQHHAQIFVAWLSEIHPPLLSAPRFKTRFCRQVPCQVDDLLLAVEAELRGGLVFSYRKRTLRCHQTWLGNPL